MAYDDAPARRRRWPLFLPLGLVAGLAVAWCGFWYFAAGKAQQGLDGWRAREAASGRIHTCASQEVGGFPFRLEVRCVGPTTELRSNQPPVVLKAKELLAAVQVYDPTLLITEFSGPLTIARARTLARLFRQLDAGPIQPARHAVIAGTRVGRGRWTCGRPSRRRRQR